jgi:heme exporter protein C
MGDVQRIFYFHVASAWVGFFAFFVTCLAGAAYLARRERRWDILALSSAEIGTAFIAMTIVTGALWAKPVWGTYWTWEPRLTISAVQLLIYAAYGMLRASVDGPERKARFAAVYGIAAFVTAPLSWFAIRWWRTIHPDILTGNGMAITPCMVYALLTSLAAFTLLYATLLRQRMRLERAADRLAHLRSQAGGE